MARSSCWAPGTRKDVRRGAGSVLRRPLALGGRWVLSCQQKLGFGLFQKHDKQPPVNRSPLDFSPRFLLLQMRNADDPMRPQEVGCFARALCTQRERILTWDLLRGPAPARLLDQADVVLMGGSGHYSATSQEPWLQRLLPFLAQLATSGKPLFASCWGFQALARALGGRVERRPEQAEVGTLPLELTEAGRQDELFGRLPNPFLGQMGHEDCVVELPPGAVWLARTQRNPYQAYRLEGLPVVCTQFHPELNRQELLARVYSYPEYVYRIAGMELDEFAAKCADTPEAERLLRDFVTSVVREN